MNPIQGHYLITPDDLTWRLSNLMRIPNADYLERTGSHNLGARLWRLPPKSANTLHKHLRAEEFYFVLEGTGRLRVGAWLILGAPEELEFLQGSRSPMDLSKIYPVDPTQLPPELAGVPWPPKE
jgi:hypothetical protein